MTNEHSGFLLLDKPENWSTFDLIRDLRKKISMRKLGHTGTLDPFATGLVILCLGKATRLSSLLLDQDKEYLAEMELGSRTDTGDISGVTIENKSIPSISDKMFTEAVKEIKNITIQTPPRYSAIKIKGKPAYKLAREGKEFDLTERMVKIHSFEICSFQNNVIVYRTKVSKGTYIRTLTEDFAELLGSVAFTRALRRISIGNIDVGQAVRPEEINETNWQDYLIPINTILRDYPHIILSGDQLALFFNGNKILLPPAEYPSEVLVFNASDKKECIGWGIIKERVLHPRKVFK